MIIEKHDGLNYYNGGVLDNSGKEFGVLVLEIVGWKDKGETLIARSNFGSGWGINGYVHVALKDKTIKSFIGVTIQTGSEL